MNQIHQGTNSYRSQTIHESSPYKLMVAENLFNPHELHLIGAFHLFQAA